MPNTIRNSCCEQPDNRIITSVSTKERKTNYSKWLKDRLHELDFTQHELARAVGKGQKTISRYINGETLPDNETADKITLYIIEKSSFIGFYHLDSKPFSIIIKELMKQHKLSQQTLADIIGKHQKDISNYCYPDKKARIDTRTQYNILRCFYELETDDEDMFLNEFTDNKSLFNFFFYADKRESLIEYYMRKYRIYPYEIQRIIEDAFFNCFTYEPVKKMYKHTEFEKNEEITSFFKKMSFSELKYIIRTLNFIINERINKNGFKHFPRISSLGEYSNTNMPPTFINPFKYNDIYEIVYEAMAQDSEQEFYINFTAESINRYPTNIQKLIIENQYAFIKKDSLFINYSEKPMELFRSLNPDNSRKILNKLEAVPPVFYRPGENKKFFTELTHYRKIVEHADRIPDYFSENATIVMENKYLKQKLIEIMNRMPNRKFDYLDEVHFKLKFTSFEWYVWMLMVSYDYCGFSVHELISEMEEMIKNQSQ